MRYPRDASHARQSILDRCAPWPLGELEPCRAVWWLVEASPRTDICGLT
jgi:hypothetical protein